FEKGENCLAELSKQPNLIILDYYLEGELNGLDTLQRIKKESPETQVIFLTSQANMQVALNSLRFGAFDYIEKNETAIEALQDALDRLDILKQSAVKKDGSVFNLFKKSMVC
ncbi:MAG: response regulator, partial [Chitinophagaceae bacterium]